MIQTSSRSRRPRARPPHEIWRFRGDPGGGAEACVKGPGATSLPPLPTARGPQQGCVPSCATLSLAPAADAANYASDLGLGALLNRAHVITVSDGVSAGTRDDVSGPAIETLLRNADFEVSGPEIVPDRQERISDSIVGAVLAGADVVVTTGGTGLGPRDVTPQATSMLIDYEVPGLGELMRRAGGSSTPMAALSRGVAGVRGRALIINVPGSVKGATESLEAVLPVLNHAVQLLHGHTQH